MRYDTQEQAQTEAEAVQAQLSPAWKVSVWQNLGWHWSLTNGYTTLCEGTFPKTYFCLITDSLDHPGSGCGDWSSPGGIHTTPQEAIKHEVLNVKEYIKVRRIQFNLIEKSFSVQ